MSVLTAEPIAASNIVEVRQDFVDERAIAMLEREQAGNGSTSPAYARALERATEDDSASETPELRVDDDGFGI